MLGIASCARTGRSLSPARCFESCNMQLCIRPCEDRRHRFDWAFSSSVRVSWIALFFWLTKISLTSISIRFCFLTSNMFFLYAKLRVQCTIHIPLLQRIRDHIYSSQNRRISRKNRIINEASAMISPPRCGRKSGTLLNPGRCLAGAG